MRNAQVVTKMMLHAQFPEDVEVDRTEVPKNSARINFWDEDWLTQLCLLQKDLWGLPNQSEPIPWSNSNLQIKTT